MAVVSTALTPGDRYELDDADVLTAHKLQYDNHRHVLARPPTASPMVMLATSNYHLFVLLQDGSVYRQHADSNLNWHRIPVPLGTTFIATAQDNLQFLHAGGTAISANRLPADGTPYITDTAGLTDIISFAGDERQRAILLGNGSVYIQAYHRGTPELIPVPADVVQIEIGIHFIYLRTGAGLIYRIKDYRQTGFDQLGGFTGATSIAVRSDHNDELWIQSPGGTTRVTPETWSSTEPLDFGWTWAVGNTVGQTPWVQNSWVKVSFA